MTRAQYVHRRWSEVCGVIYATFATPRPYVARRVFWNCPWTHRGTRSEWNSVGPLQGRKAVAPDTVYRLLDSRPATKILIIPAENPRLGTVYIYIFHRSTMGNAQSNQVRPLSYQYNPRCVVLRQLRDYKIAPSFYNYYEHCGQRPTLCMFCLLFPIH